MSKILKNVHASATALNKAGFIDGVTMREFDELCLSIPREYSAEDVRKIRQTSNVSQAVFAKYINVKKLTVSAWEQGKKKPSGAAAKLLDLVERKGLEVLQ